MNIDKFKIKSLLIQTLVTSLVGLVITFFFNYFTTEKAILKYSFDVVGGKNDTLASIVRNVYFPGLSDTLFTTYIEVTIANKGNKECEDISMLLKFKKHIKLEDISMLKEPPMIPVEIKYDSLIKSYVYHIASLNPDESVFFKITSKGRLDESVDPVIRCKGLIAEKTNNINDPSLAEFLIHLFFGVSIAVGIVLIPFNFVRKRVTRNRYS